MVLEGVYVQTMTTLALKKKTRIANSERPLLPRIPLVGHLTRHIGKTRDGSLVAVIELGGRSYESADADARGGDSDALNNFVRGIASPRLGLWSHQIRRRVQVAVPGTYGSAFAQQVHDEYNARLQEQPMYSTRLFLSFLYRATAVDKAIGSIFKSKDQQLVRDALQEARDALEAIIGQALSDLEDYDPRLLGTEKRGQLTYSEIGRFYSDLLNYRGRDIPLAPYDMGEAIGDRRPIFGGETLEIRHPTHTTYGVALGIKEYLPDTWPDMWSTLLELPYEYTLTQSFLMVPKHRATSALKLQRRRMVMAEDDAVSQIDDLNDAVDQLKNNQFTMGEHNAALFVYADSIPELKTAVSESYTALADPGLIVVREDVVLEAQYWAMLPGNHAMAPRASLITSRNFVCFSPFYNYPQGCPHGHHWGDALTVFRSTVNSPVWFTTHVGDLGHLSIVGMTGAGKTVLVTFLLLCLQRFGVRNIFFDLDRGAHVAIVALGGNYLPLRLDEPTGFNPFALTLTGTHRQYLMDLVGLLVGTSLDAAESADVTIAIDSVYQLDPALRRLSALPHFLNTTDPNGVAARLAPWVGDGRRSWVFDNLDDRLNFEHTITAFDITDFIDDPALRTPIMSYLVYRMDPCIDGTPVAIWIEEAWKALDDPFFEPFVKKKLKTLRKQNGIFITATQSPADNLKSPIADTLLEQNATSIFLPNERAKRSDYVDGYKLTSAEWDLLKPLRRTAHRFLLKQSDHGVLCRLDLSGMDRILAVLSGTTAGNAIFDRLLEQHDGTLPENWLDTFCNEVLQ